MLQACLHKHFLCIDYKEDIYPEIKDKGKKYINKKILELSKDELLKFKDTSYDIILFDRSLSDRLIWIDRLFKQGDLDESEYNDSYFYLLFL